jgi:hypothetical protein
MIIVYYILSGLLILELGFMLVSQIMIVRPIDDGFVTLYDDCHEGIDEVCNSTLEYYMLSPYAKTVVSNDLNDNKVQGDK